MDASVRMFQCRNSVSADGLGAQEFVLKGTKPKICFEKQDMQTNKKIIRETGEGRMCVRDIVVQVISLDDQEWHF